MLNTEPRQNAIAKRYGGVLFSLAQENKVLKDVLKDIIRLHKCLLQEPLEWKRITSPTTPLKIQHQITQKLAISLKQGKLTTQFLKVVCHHHRLQHLVFIVEDFINRCKESVDGIIETGDELSQEEINHLEKALKRHLDKDVSLHQIINDKLLGGIILRIGTLMIDASIETQLNKLRHVMRG